MVIPPHIHFFKKEKGGDSFRSEYSNSWFLLQSPRTSDQCNWWEPDVSCYWGKCFFKQWHKQLDVPAYSETLSVLHVIWQLWKSFGFLLQPKEILLLGLMGRGHHLGNLGAEGCGFTLLLVTMATVPVVHPSSQLMGLGLCCSWTKSFLNKSPVLHIIIPTELESCFHREALVLYSNCL